MSRWPKKETSDSVTEKPTPRISVLERRLQNPFGEPSQTIRFKARGDCLVEGHWFNEATRPGQIHRAKELGWVPVVPDMIEDMDSIGYHTISAAHQIVRGQRGEEVLMWMPQSDYQRIQFAKAKKNLDDMRDFDKEKHKMLNAAAAKYGGQSADYLNRHVGPVGSVMDNLERVERIEDENS
jgi:hypothetical protein